MADAQRKRPRDASVSPDTSIDIDADVSEKRRLTVKVDQMASQLVTSYNKRRPIETVNTRKKLKVDGMGQARRYEWVGEPVAREVGDVLREYFDGVVLNGSRYKVCTRPHATGGAIRSLVVCCERSEALNGSG